MKSTSLSGFWRGFSAVFGALRLLARLPASWPYALVPAVVFVVLEAGFVALSWELLKPWVERELAGGGGLRDLGATAASWLALLLATGLGWVVAAFITPPLSAPALERIVALVERDAKAPARRAPGFWAELGCGLRALLLGGLVSLPLVLGLTLLELLLPPAAVVTTPLKLLVAAFGVAWGLLDYPLTLRGVGARQRLRFMGQHFAAMLGFGVAFAAVFWLPCCGITMLPVGVAAATRLLWELQAPAAGGEQLPDASRSS